jgi:hypothetical protein
VICTKYFLGASVCVDGCRSRQVAAADSDVETPSYPAARSISKNILSICNFHPQQSSPWNCITTHLSPRSHERDALPPKEAPAIRQVLAHHDSTLKDQQIPPRSAARQAPHLERAPLPPEPLFTVCINSPTMFPRHSHAQPNGHAYGTSNTFSISPHRCGLPPCRAPPGGATTDETCQISTSNTTSAAMATATVCKNWRDSVILLDHSPSHIPVVPRHPTARSGSRLHPAR